jgi:hypothetical protein
MINSNYCARGAIPLAFPKWCLATITGIPWFPAATEAVCLKKKIRFISRLLKNWMNTLLCYITWNHKKCTQTVQWTWNAHTLTFHGHHHQTVKHSPGSNWKFPW